MKKAITLIAMVYICYASMGQSLNNISVNNIDGNSISWSSYQGSKILIFIAPISLNHVVKLKEIDSFKTLYDTSIKLIGVMSYEDGYVDSNKTKIKALYTSKGINITLTEGMHTKKSAGTNQSALFNWLTTKTLNGRFNTDAKGIGQKFFIDKNGKLFAVLSTEIPFLSPIVETYINRKS